MLKNSNLGDVTGDLEGLRRHISCSKASAPIFSFYHLHSLPPASEPTMCCGERAGNGYRQAQHPAILFVQMEASDGLCMKRLMFEFTSLRSFSCRPEKWWVSHFWRRYAWEYHRCSFGSCPASIVARLPRLSLCPSQRTAPGHRHTKNTRELLIHATAFFDLPHFLLCIC